MALGNVYSMHQLHKDVLLCLHGELVREMRMTDKFLTNLEEKRVLSPSMRQRIEAKGSADDADDQTREFLTILPKRGPDAFARTLRCLELSDQHGVAAALRDEVARRGDSVASTAVAGSDVRDNRAQSPASPYLPATVDNLRVLPYTVKSLPHHGYLLIVNVLNVRNQEERVGSEVDIANLQKTFAPFHYKPLVVQDEPTQPMTRRRMLAEIRTFATSPMHAEVDAFVLALMTHGDANDELMASDGETVSLVEVKAAVEESTYLRGKPKMLIVQACRGDNEDKPSMDGVDSGSTGDDDGDLLPVGLQRFERIDSPVESREFFPNDDNGATAGSSTSTREPRFAHFVTARSSVSGHVSYRTADNGSWFIEDLCSTVREMGDRTDVVGLLYEVVDKMSKRMAHNRALSICEATTTLNKPFFLSTLNSV